MTQLDTCPSHCCLSPLSLCPDWIPVLYLSPSPSFENLCHPALKSFIGTSPNWCGLSWICTSFVSPSLIGFGGLVAQSCPTLCHPMDCSPPGSSVHVILPARILEWIAIPFSRVSSQSRDWTQVSHIAGRFLTIWATGQPFVGFNPLYSHLWRRQWHPTPVLLPGKSHGRRSLVGCSPWGREELDTTERLDFHFSLSCIGEGNGTHSSVLAWRIPGTGEPGWLPSMGWHRVRHDWSDLAAAAAAAA